MLSKFFRLKQAMFLLLIIFFLSSCATRYKDALFTSKTDLVTDTLKTVYVVNDNGPKDSYYRIKANDVLAIKNLQDVEFGAQSGSTATAGVASPVTFTVDADGSVRLPAVGKVQLSGLTRGEATAKLQELYEKMLLKNPIIDLRIVNLKVTLLGEFNAQGNYLLEKDNTTLIDILGQAGGFTEKADPKRLKIIRGDRSNPEVIYANLKDINSLASPKLILQNNDILYMEPRTLATEKLQTIVTYMQPVILIITTFVLLNNNR